MVTMAPSLMGHLATSGHCDMVLLTPRPSGDVVLQQQTPSQMHLQAYANYAMGPPQVDFSFRDEPPTTLYLYMFGVCFLLSGAMLDVMFTYGAQPLAFALLQSFGTYPWKAYVQPGNGHWPTLGMYRVAAPSTPLHRGQPPATKSAVPQPFQLHGGANSFWGLAESHLTWSLRLPCMVGRGLLYQVWFHPLT